jgi:flagellar assembly protein FliH
LSRALVKGFTAPASFMQELPPIDPLQKANLSKRISGRVKTELQEIRDKAAEEGHAEGYSDGYATGQAEGFESGFQKGKREARADFDSQNRQLIDATSLQLAEIVRQAQAAFDDWRAQTESDLAEIAIEIVRDALQAELAISRESVMEITRAALQSIIGTGTVHIRVNPLDTGLLEARLKELQDAAGRHRNLEVVADPSVEAGCRLITDGGVVDASVEGFIERLEDAMDDAA